MGQTAGTESGIRGLHGMSPHCPYVPWGLRDGTDGWDGQLKQRPTEGTPWDVPSLSIRPLGTKGWDGQLGKRPTEGTPWDCNVHPPLLDAMPWDSWESQIPPGQSMAILDNPRTVPALYPGLYWPCTIRKDVQALHYMQGCAGPALCAGLYSHCTIHRIHRAVEVLYYTQVFVGLVLYTGLYSLCTVRRA